MASKGNSGKSGKTEGRRTASAAGPDASPAPFPIAGLGASAGGLEALEQFFRAVPADSGMGYVVVQHLDPSHASILSEILQRSTPMPVVEAQDQMPVQPDHVYVIPPNRDMLIRQGSLQLSLPAEPRGQRMPIDAFLRSLAEDRGEASAGIILSGTGTDGTLGMRAVFGAGGLCLVQDPATARYDGMPASVIQRGFASRVLPAEQMPLALRDGMRPLPIRQTLVAAPAASAAGLGPILTQLRSGTGHDFSLYKKTTIGRRIERRMSLHGIEDAAVYTRFLKEHPSEVQALFRELLINVTSFFRDSEAFAVLRREVLPAMLADKPAGYVFRAWVAGCATGEEAYSLAMLLREVMDEQQRELKVQLYSTDLDDDAIATARTGLYPPNIAQDVSPERLRRFFTKEDTGYRVRKEIREMAVFAVQSVIKDPPFTRLDLLACRNLMIYLEPELQNRLIPAFHYALKPHGVLVLSPSESIGSHTELFEPIDRKWKIYRSRPTTASTRAVLGSGLSWTAEGSTAAPAAGAHGLRETQVAEFAKRMLLQSFAPAAVVTDQKGQVLYVHGDTGKFLRPAPGQPSNSLVDMAREGLTMPLREALQTAAGEGQPTLNRECGVKTNGDIATVRLSVRLMPDPDVAQAMLLVSFEEVPRTALAKPVRRSRAKGPTEPSRAEALERELAYAKESMSAMLEEQQASNEELKSTNEELQSTNEELQSTNEELETSKEELQSVNEELVTVNAELQNKIEQMAGMQDDMKNLLDNIRVGTIFLDRHLMIRRFTRDATQVFRLVGTDVGRPLTDIRSELQGDDLLADAQSVLDSLVPIEREVCTAGGTWYLARIQPYRTIDNLIDGVVLTFADVTERVGAIAARKALDLAEAIVDTVQHPLAVLDGQLKLISANRAFYRDFGGTPADMLGRTLQETCAAGPWNLPALREWLAADLPTEPHQQRLLVEYDVPGLGQRRLSLSLHRIVGQAGAPPLVLLSIEPADEARP